VRTAGLLARVAVRRVGEGDLVVAGERRGRAATKRGWQFIAGVGLGDLDDAGHLRVALCENLQRADLDPLEEARGYQQLQELGMTQEQIAEAVHRSRPAIANAVRLLKAPPAVQEKLRTGAIDKSHVLALLGKFEAFPEALVKVAEVAAERHTPSKELEKPLEWTFTGPLKEAKLAVEVSGAAFDWERACKKKCPFGAFQSSGYYGGLCFKPEHFRELQKTARAAKKAEVQKAIDAASTDGKTTLKLNSLSYQSYERLDYGNGKPKGCTKDCECRAQALDSQNHPVPICTKPGRFRQLQQDERRQADAARKQRAKDLAERCGQILDVVDDVRSRELAVLACWACAHMSAKVYAELLAKYAPTLKAKSAVSPDDFLKLEPLQLVKLAVEALLSRDIENLSEWNPKAPYADWYAGSLKVPKPNAAKQAKRAKAALPKVSPEATLAAVGAELHELLEETPA